MPFIDLIKISWPYILSLGSLILLSYTAVHILLNKHDTRAATGWLGLVWFAPIIGICLYWLLGVNRIKRKARARLASRRAIPLPERKLAVAPQDVIRLLKIEEQNGLAMLCQLTEKVTRQPLMEGNEITPLINGDQAYPAMLEAIQTATYSISLCTYIFDNDSWGSKFRSALKDARERGVSVKVLIDGVGARYSRPPMARKLRRDGIETVCFMQTFLPWRFRYLNLRNHRKLLVLDGKTGFTGGMNIREGNYLSDNPENPIQDIHFQIMGPVVAELQKAFAEDWSFSTGEKLTGEKWFPELNPAGNGVARGISDGPDEDYDTLRMVILGALSSAQTSIKVASPYFLPDDELITGLCTAALRGINVQILLPSKPNLRMIKWASEAGLERLLESGCTLMLSDPPFDHSKIMIIDHGWVLLGSANWDTRSLKLNFEFNVECYDAALAHSIEIIFDNKIKSAHFVSLQEIQEKPLLTRLRNKFFRLFLPYL
ncbi:MAG: cardiolipin synthase [Desulfobulbaceae bacterium]|uniref:Cardiolipin synthase n=1 Tax=Candidatus Desulfobia pelagia TaxID=2841692 RepID=A0A8J6NBP3_9BACT|nr:cardiolipin synthase [Candidatus Desulfobia pelagia]